MEEKVTKGIEELKAENEMLKKQLGNVYNQLKERDFAIMMNRLSFLFKIVENNSMFDADTIVMATDEIKEALFPKEEDNKSKEA